MSSTLLSVGANPRFVGDDPTGTTKTIEGNTECGFLCSHDAIVYGYNLQEPTRIISKEHAVNVFLF